MAASPPSAAPRGASHSSGQRVTPRLARLRTQSRYMRQQADHPVTSNLLDQHRADDRRELAQQAEHLLANVERRRQLIMRNRGQSVQTHCS
eukprot:4597399-Pyramimonas_sp.AAC.1